jgi:hypothetical protein
VLRLVDGIWRHPAMPEDERVRRAS